MGRAEDNWERLVRAALRRELPGDADGQLITGEDGARPTYHRQIEGSGDLEKEFVKELERVSVDVLEDITEERVAVAVPEHFKYGKRNVQWALDNVAKDSAGLVIIHVHCPKMILTASITRKSREKLRAEAEVKLGEYANMCNEQKVRCKIEIIDNEDVAEGLQELITKLGITKLVMGAAADKHYSKNRRGELLKSKTARKLLELAAVAVASGKCKIWFTCKGNFICTARSYVETRKLLGSDALPGQRCPGQGFNQRGSEYRRRSEGIWGAPLNKEERYLDSEDLLKKFGETFRHMSDISLLKQQSFHDEMRARYESTYKSAAQYELLIDVLGRDNKRLREELDAAVKNQKLAADSQDDADHPPHYFVCPITRLVMENPSLAADGYTYEDSAIRQWLMEHRHGTSPITRERLAHCELIPNRALRSAIEDWERKQGQSSQAGPSRNRERCVNGGP